MGSAMTNRGGIMASAPSLSYGGSRRDETKQGCLGDRRRSGVLSCAPQQKREPLPHFLRENSPALAHGGGAIDDSAKGGGPMARLRGRPVGNSTDKHMPRTTNVTECCAQKGAHEKIGKGLEATLMSIS